MKSSALGMGKRIAFRPTLTSASSISANLFDPIQPPRNGTARTSKAKSIRRKPSSEINEAVATAARPAEVRTQSKRQAASRYYDKQIRTGVKDFCGYYWPKDMAQVTGYYDNGAIIRPKELPPIAPFLRGGLSADRIPAAEQQIRAGIRRRTPLTDAMASHIPAQLKKNRDIMKDFNERQQRGARQKKWREARLAPAPIPERRGRLSLLSGRRKRKA